MKTNYIFVFFLALYISCSPDNHRTEEQEAERISQSKKDSVLREITRKYTIENKLDTIFNSREFTLSYQKLFKNGDSQLLEVELYDIDDIYLRDSTYYLMIGGKPWLNMSLELSIQSENLQSLFIEDEINAFLVLNVRKVKKVYFEIKTNVIDSDPELDYYDIDLSLRGTRKLILEGEVVDVFTIPNSHSSNK